MEFENVIEGIFKDKTMYQRPEQVDEYLKEQGVKIENKSMLILLRRLAENDIWKWLTYICCKLPDVVSTEQGFLSLLKCIAQKVKGDMAQGPFQEVLVNVGKKNPGLGLELSGEMMNYDSDLVFYASFPLGGAGKTNFDKAFNVIKRELGNSDENRRATGIRALRIVFAKEERVERDLSSIFSILDSASSNKEEIVVRMEVMSAYVDFVKLYPDECIKHLTRFAQEANSILRYQLVNMLQVCNLPRAQDTIELLRICSEDTNPKVLDEISSTLAIKGRDYPEETLEIIKQWVKRGEYYKIPSIDYCLQEIGKAHLDVCIKMIEIWMDKETDHRISYFLPRILVDLCKSDFGTLMKSAKTWSGRDGAFPEVAIRAIREFLNEIYPNIASKQDMIDSCFDLLVELAQNRRIAVEAVIKDEPQKFFQCFKLLKEIEQDRKELDFDRILASLKIFKYVDQFIGNDWFEEKKSENNKTHPLLILLSIQNTVFLNHLDEAIGIIINKSTKIRDLRSGLRNEDQFWQTISEIEVISTFMKRYTVEIAPEAQGKVLDAGVKIDGRKLLIEVISPQMFKPLKYLTRAIGVKNRARDKIYDEFKEHLLSNVSNIDLPILIFIDTGRSEINHEFVEDYLTGSLQLVIITNKMSGNVIQTFPERAKDFMHNLDERTDVLSAVVCFAPAYDKNGHVVFRGSIILNPHAKIPLDAELAEKIAQTMFFSD